MMLQEIVIMKRFLILALSLTTLSAFSQSVEEEAIILNQELQFLEDSVKNIQSVSTNANDEVQKNKAINEPSLERTYFGEDVEEDTVSTRTAGPKRRSL
jgi:transcriptional regulatory protein LevR